MSSLMKFHVRFPRFSSLSLLTSSLSLSRSFFYFFVFYFFFFFFYFFLLSPSRVVSLSLDRTR